jgi:hypothetical protein
MIRDVYRESQIQHPDFFHFGSRIQGGGVQKATDTKSWIRKTAKKH